NEIQKIRFAANTNSTGTFPGSIAGYSIYMKNVAAGTKTFTAGSYSLSGYTLVYTGALSATSAGAPYSFTFDAEVTLTTPFARTAGNNLQVLILRNSGIAATGYAWDCSNGNSVDGGTANTSRRYNGATQAVENSTSLSVSAFRPAIQLIRPVSNDATVTVDGATLPTASCFSTPQTVIAYLKNSGTSTIAIGGASVKIDVTGANTYTTTVNNTGALAANASEMIIFSGINLNNAGVNNFKIYSTMAGDGNATNDTAAFTITTTATYNTYPVNTSAETNNLVFQYLKTLNVSNHWTLNSAITASATGAFKNTDLTDSIFPKTGTRFYVQDNYSGANSTGHSSVLYAGCFNFSSPANISFWMTQDNSLNTSLDSIYVVVSTDKAATWTRLQGFGGLSASALLPTWVQQTVSLNSYAGQTIHIGLEGVSKWGNVIGVDDISVTANAPVPVTFGEFVGVRENNSNQLKWNTYTETNNQGFELQRSVNGTEFTTIAFVPTKAINGNSNSELNYTFQDKASSATTYYQLKQLDKDGKYAYSKVVSIKGEKPTRFELANLYPNPAKETIKVTVAAPKAAVVTLTVTDMTGKVVMKQNNQLTMGDNNIALNVAALNAGNYIVRLSCADGCEYSIQRFVKQ
ncbi:MAG TPA: T9SS type A sorting domain-containing protein, partial [Chitinophagaceae bacterium]|nr:T9SS type A sorting domain-containing protein [Chitinophagaceae bacterium]